MDPRSRLGGARSLRRVPMLKDASWSAPSSFPPGGTAVHRQTDRAGTNFAAQAVIAIENTRLLNELRQRTEISPSCWSSRPRPRVLKVIPARPSISSRCSRPCSRTRPASAKPVWQFSARPRALAFAALHNAPSAFADRDQRGRSSAAPDELVPIYPSRCHVPT